MGLISDFFVASEADARSLGPDELPRDRFAALEARNIDPVKLATLEAITRGIDLADVSTVMDLIQRPVVIRNDGEQVLLPVSPMLVEACAAWSDSEMTAIAGTWAATEEMALDGCAPEEAAALLRELRRLCQTALTSNAAVFQYLCV